MRSKINFENPFYILLVSFFTIILFISCGFKNQDDTISIENDIIYDSVIPYEKVTTLKENLEFIGNIKSLSFINLEEFVIAMTNPPAVMLYNIDGNQTRRIGNMGSGAFEYGSPSIVKGYNEDIFIWCSMYTKLFVFDKYGNPINEYQFDNAIQNFEVNDNYIFFYTVGGFVNRKIIEIYDISSEKIVQEIGNKSNKQLLLDHNGISGAMTLHENNLFFSLNHNPFIYRIDVRDFSKSTYQISDPEFNAIDEDITPEDVQKDPMGTIKHIVGSDMITGMFWVDGSLIVVAEIGEIEMNELNYQDFSKRMHRYYVLDSHMNLKYAIKAKANLYFNPGFFTVQDNNLYGITVVDDGESIEYQLARLKTTW